MNKFKEIRPIVVGIVEKDNKILVQEGFDKVKNQEFYRALGGGIEFLETSEQALIREFKEEINADIKILDKLDVVENIFEYEGKKAHEIVFIYNVEIPNEQIKNEYLIIEDEVKSYAKWIDKEEFISNKKIVYPEISKDYL